MQSDTILFQTAEQPFFTGEAGVKDHFRQNYEKYCGRNDAASEALSESLVKRIASEGDAFSFYLTNQNSRKTAQCCLEKNCVRAIERRIAINELSVHFRVNHENLYESQKRSLLVQTTESQPENPMSGIGLSV